MEMQFLNSDNHSLCLGTRPVLVIFAGLLFAGKIFCRIYFANISLPWGSNSTLVSVSLLEGFPAVQLLIYLIYPVSGLVL